MFRISNFPLVSHQKCLLSTRPWWSPSVHPPPLGLASLPAPSRHIPLSHGTSCTPPPNKCGCRRQFPYFQSRVPVTFLTKVFLPGEKHFIDRKDKINTDALTYIHSKHSKLKKKELPTSLLTRCVFTMRGKKSAY